MQKGKSLAINDSYRVSLQRHIMVVVNRLVYTRTGPYSIFIILCRGTVAQHHQTTELSGHK